MCAYLKDYELIDYIFDKCIDEKFILHIHLLPRPLLLNEERYGIV
jgi:hypothetical protein